MAALSGPLSKRRLGTRSGDLRRLARQAERDGADGAANQLYLAGAQAKLGEGSAISSAEGNIAAADLERRASQGLAQTKMDLLAGKTTAATGGLLGERQKLFGQAKAAGGFDDTMRSRARELGVTDSGLSLAERKIPQVKTGGDNGIPDLIQRPTANTPTIKPSNTGSVAGKSTLTAPKNAAEQAADDVFGTKFATPAPAREGRINGLPASKTLASMRRPDTTEPGNLADTKARDAADREAAINAAISESAGNAKVTRGSVIDRINTERAAKGLQTYGEDIYKDIAGRDIAKSDARLADQKFGRTDFGKAFNAPASPLSADELNPLVQRKGLPAVPPVVSLPKPAAVPQGGFQSNVSPEERERVRQLGAKNLADANQPSTLRNLGRGIRGLGDGVIPTRDDILTRRKEEAARVEEAKRRNAAFNKRAVGAVKTGWNEFSEGLSGR